MLHISGPLRAGFLTRKRPEQLPCPAGSEEECGSQALQASPSLGPRWVRVTAVEYGHQRSPTVANGSEQPQVAGPFAHAPAMMRAGDSDCGPEGRSLGTVP
jgi:hypothetical protein